MLRVVRRMSTAFLIAGFLLLGLFWLLTDLTLRAQSAASA
jgi:hypothetical protein